ncbi:MAG: DNA alkylation repair protein [Bacilli bacterium]|nr:DNA alkylation repair protein [Bacilli bacterium]MBP3920048.1 DNA alkylation repair protein [Bacilli bacterium]
MDNIKDILYDNQDIKYRDFHYNLLNNKDIKMIGVRTPILKKISKKLAKNDYELFIKNNKHETYEEITLEGLLIGYLKLDFNIIIKYLDNFIPYINNWATCDLTCSNLKIFKQEQIKGFNYIKKCLKNKNPWKQRVGIVLLNSHYINDDYIDEILSIINIKSNEYYVEMALAWLISTCFIKYKDKTINFLNNNNLNDFTYNKAIQKITESTRVGKDEKEQIRKLKRF